MIKKLFNMGVAIIVLVVVFYITTALCDKACHIGGYYNDGYRESASLLEKW